MAEAGRQESDLVQTVVIKPETRYSLSAWIQGAGASMTIGELATQTGKSRSLKYWKVDSDDRTGWQQISIAFTSSKNTTDARVRLSGEQVVWDAVQLEQGSDPGPYRADGLLLERPAQNLLANTSLEVNAADWNGLNSYVSVTAAPDFARYGRHGLLVRKLQAGRAATFQPAALVPGRLYTYSAYARLPDGQPITNEVLRGWYYEGTNQPEGVNTALIGERHRPLMRWTAVGGGWYRGHFTFEATENKGLYGLLSTEAVQTGEQYYIDGAQLEAGRHMSSYIDGSLGEGYSWTGEPFASTSERARTTVEYGKTVGQQGAVLFWARPDATAPYDATLLQLGKLRIAVNGQKLNLRDGDRTLASAAWKPGAARSYAVLWDGPTVSLWMDGARAGLSRAEPPVAGATLTLGPGKGWSYPNAVVGDVSLWRTPPTDGEVAFLAAQGPLDPGAHSVRGQYTTVATSAADETRGEIKAEWSVDGTTWYPWEGATGLHNWDLGDQEGVKTVWIRYTDAADNWLVYTDTVVRDTTSPRVTSASLKANIVTLRFTEPVSGDTLSSAVLTSRGRRVSGTWDYSPGDTIATFKVPARSATQLELRVTTGLRDRAGNPIAAPYQVTLVPTP